MTKKPEQQHRRTFWSHKTQVTVNVLLALTSLSLTLGTLYLMHRSNRASATAVYSDHQPIISIRNGDGFQVNLAPYSTSTPDRYDAKVRFSIKNVGNGIAHNVNYAILDFHNNSEVGSINLTPEKGEIIRTDYSFLPGEEMPILYDDKSYVLHKIIDGDNERDCIAVAVSYEQHNLDGTIFPHSFLLRIRPYWIDKKYGRAGIVALEQTYSSAIPLNLKLSNRKQHPFKPTRHIFPTENSATNLHSK